MKWRVIIRPRAESDLQDARDWYQKQRSGLGEEFIAEIAKSIQRLAQNPEVNAEYYRGIPPSDDEALSLQIILPSRTRPGHCIPGSARTERSSPAAFARTLSQLVSAIGDYPQKHL